MLERIFKITGAYDLTRPDPSENYGMGSMQMFFAVSGPKGGVSALLNTSWYLPAQQRSSFEMYTKTPFNPLEDLMAPKWWDISQHYKTSQYDWQTPMHDCEVTKGDCYADGTSLWGQEKWLLGFLHGGSDWLFTRLEEYYNNVFEDGPMPDLTPIPRKHPKEQI